jgi:hypothetical protein
MTKTLVSTVLGTEPGRGRGMCHGKTNGLVAGESGTLYGGTECEALFQPIISGLPQEGTEDAVSYAPPETGKLEKPHCS